MFWHVARVRVKRARKKISEGMLDEGLELLDGMTLEERNVDEVLFLRAKIAHLKGHYDLALRLIRDIKSESDDSILLEVSIIVSMGMADLQWLTSIQKLMLLESSPLRSRNKVVNRR